MTKKSYLIRRYLRDRKTGWPLVREYVVHSVRTPKMDVRAGTVSVIPVGSSISDLTGKTLNDWLSPYSRKSLIEAGVKSE